MQAYVYKSRRKSDTYVYLREREGFGLIPEPLRASLGALEFVLEVALGPERKLARADAQVVRSNLAASGYHLQFPPQPDGAQPAAVVEHLRDMAAFAPPVPAVDSGVCAPGAKPNTAAPGELPVRRNDTHGDA